MPMPFRENGRRVVWTARLSEAEAADAAAICGKAGHSQWLQGLVRAAIANGNGRSETEDLRALVADLEADLEQERNDRRTPRCQQCGTALACPRCHGGGEYA